MTEYSRHLSANSYRLTGGYLTVGQGMGQTAQGHHGRGAVSVTARVLDLDVTLVNWEGRGAAADSTPTTSRYPSRRRSRTTTSTESSRRRPLTTLRQERTDDDPDGPQ
jgi:hypothetical protein